MPTWFSDIISGSVNTVIDGVFGIIASFLPTIPNNYYEFVTAINTAFLVAKQFSFIIPFGTLFTCLGIYFTIEIALLSLKFAMWIIKVIRG